MTVVTETTSQQLFCEAQKIIPGGVNSPVRAFRAVGGDPLFIQSAQGAYITDVDHRTFIDYVGSWGPMILGHAHPAVIEAVIHTAKNGLSFGAPCELEIKLATEICKRVRSVDQVRMMSSGTEAAMTALRLARGITKRNKIVKFEGCYHGHADALLVKAGSGALTLGIPDSAGVSDAIAQNTLTARFNDIDSVVKLFEVHGRDIACIIVEPIAGNMNLVLPNPGFLETLREICNHYESLLIFDEVITGFRVGFQGMQSHTGVTPDLTVFGKIIGGGMPVGAVGGRREWMQYLAPVGPVYQAGTLSGNPVAMAAGLATLQQLTPEKYILLSEKTALLARGLQDAARTHSIPLQINHHTGLFGIFFTQAPVVSTYAAFFHGMLARQVYLAPSAFESGFMSLAHSESDIQKTIQAAHEVFEKMKKETK